MGIQLFSRTVLDKLSEEKTNSKDFYYCLVTLSLHKEVMLALQGAQKLRVRPKGLFRTTIQEPWYCYGALHWVLTSATRAAAASVGTTSAL